LRSFSVRWIGCAVAGATIMLASPALAQDISVTFGQGAGLTERVLQLIALLTVLSLAPFLTAFVMGPAFQRSYDTGIRPLVANEITAEQAFERSSDPFRVFMQKNVRDKDLKLFMDLSNTPTPAKPEDLSLRVLVPAFMISELKRAFEIGFLLFLPFLIIDLVVASVLMSMGMMMLPPVVVSLPFKLIFFVLVDGWHLVAGSLVQSYGAS